MLAGDSQNEEMKNPQHPSVCVCVDVQICGDKYQDRNIVTNAEGD